MFIPVLVLLITGFLSPAQNRLTCNLKVPGTVNIKKVYLRLLDSSGKEIFKNSIAPYGIRNDIPLPAVSVGESRFNADIHGDGNRIKFGIHSNRHEKGFVKLFNITGKEITGLGYPIFPGENFISFDAGNLLSGVYIASYSSPSGKKSVKIVSGFD